MRAGAGVTVGIRRAKAAWMLVLGSAACFSEGPTETVDSPETLVVVQGVVRADLAQQWILVERSFNGTTSGYIGGFIPGAGVEVPVEGAGVTISNVSLPTDPCGSSVTLLEGLGPADRVQPGVYFSPVGCPTIRPGDTLALVVNDRDDRVTGRTIVPGTSAMTISVGGLSASVPGRTLEFNRDTDTLRVEVDPLGGRSLVVEIGERRFVESHDFLATESSQFWVDAPDMLLPGDLPDIFEDGDFEEDEPIPPVFMAGRLHWLSVAYADQNFFDQVRSENTEVTGRGFINTLEGGLGFFGSMTAAQTNLRVIGEIDDVREGEYTMTGTVEGVTVSVDWELYVNRTDDMGYAEFSAFVEGNWVLGAYDAWTLGEFSDEFVTAFVAQPTGETTVEGERELAVWGIRGGLAAAGTSTLAVLRDGAEVGTLEATKR